MGKFDHIIIVTDMDGTFLDSSSRPVEKNIRAVEAFCREGGHFTFATGRMHGDFALRMPELLPLANLPAILVNGGYLYDFATKTVIEADYLDNEIARDLQTLINRDYPDVGLRLTTSTGFLMETMTDMIARDMRGMMDIVEVRAADAWGDVLCHKAVARGDADVLLRLWADVEAEWPGKISVTRSGSRTLEIMPAGISKATRFPCLRRICETDGKPPVIYAVGDYENDAEMLRAADVAVCPTNALPAIREICDITPASNDEGVIAALIASLDG